MSSVRRLSSMLEASRVYGSPEGFKVRRGKAQRYPGITNIDKQDDIVYDDINNNYWVDTEAGSLEFGISRKVWFDYKGKSLVADVWAIFFLYLVNGKIEASCVVDASRPYYDYIEFYEAGSYKQLDEDDFDDDELEALAAQVMNRTGYIEMQDWINQLERDPEVLRFVKDVFADEGIVSESRRRISRRPVRRRVGTSESRLRANRSRRQVGTSESRLRASRLRRGRLSRRVR